MKALSAEGLAAAVLERDRLELEAERTAEETADLRYWGLRAGSIAGSLNAAEERELYALEIFRAIE